MAFPFLAIPGIIGALGSLFGGKGQKTQYANMQDPQSAAARSSLMSMIAAMMKKNKGVSAGVQPTTDALNLLYSKFFNRPYTPNVQMGTGVAPTYGGPPPGLEQNPYRQVQPNPNEFRA